MHKAAEGGSLDVIKYLLPMFGARAHEMDADSYTMLHWAARCGHCQVARYLIESLKMDPQDRDKVCVGGGGGGEGGNVPRERKTYMLQNNLFTLSPVVCNLAILCDVVPRRKAVCSYEKPAC